MELKSKDKNYTFVDMNYLRRLLFPLAAVYYLITLLRNFFYDQNLLVSKKYKFPLIGIGNLSMGGTGKTPMTEYVLRLLQERGQVATLSRGYGRSTRGYRDVSVHDDPKKVGDEPLQMARKFPQVQVAVCEDRRTGISVLREKNVRPTTIVLDDVFQHRKVHPNFLILLTSYTDLFTKDFILPVGNLRESRNGAERADAVVVTKCPETISVAERNAIKSSIASYTPAPVFFSSILYGDEIYGTSKMNLKELRGGRIALVTGIANPDPLVHYVAQNSLEYEHHKFHDHHNFTDQEIQVLDQNKVILTTEKDYMRLKNKIKNASLYYLPIKMKLLENASDFDALILDAAGK